MSGMQEKFRDGLENNVVIDKAKEKIKDFKKNHSSDVWVYMKERLGDKFCEEEFEQEIQYLF